MTTKKGAQFSLEECSCIEMMAQFRRQQGVGEAWAEMMAQFANPQGSDGKCFEMMTQMMASCCGTEREDDHISREA